MYQDTSSREETIQEGETGREMLESKTEEVNFHNAANPTLMKRRSAPVALALRTHELLPCTRYARNTRGGTHGLRVISKRAGSQASVEMWCSSWTMRFSTAE